MFVRRSINKWVKRWLKRRLPAANEIKLSNRRLFIFPTRTGFVWLALLILCWLVATNYENNIVFGFTCLLTSLFIVSILATYANLSGISVRYAHCAPVFAGESTLAHVVLTRNSKRPRFALQLYFCKDNKVEVTLSKQEHLTIKIPVLTDHRGWFDPGWLYIESIYPLGLLRVWSRLDLDIRCLVYPKPVVDTPIDSHASGAAGDLVFASEGHEDFVGLNDYRQGDSLKRVAWKQFARGQGMHVKHYADYQSDELWLNWDAFPGRDREARLSRLCGWLLQVENRNLNNENYGLKLPGLEITPARGDIHRQKILQHLALFELGNSHGENLGADVK